MQCSTFILSPAQIRVSLLETRYVSAYSWTDTMQQAEPRFEWPEIFKVVAFTTAGSLAYAIIIPLIGAALGPSGSTGPTAGSDVFLWSSRGLLLALIIWRGATMGRLVGDRIVDDMLVGSVVAFVGWLLVKIVVLVIIYQGEAEGQPIPLIHVSDLITPPAAVFVSWLGAKANRF